MKKIIFLMACALTPYLAAEASAQMVCTVVGQEFCSAGKVYRCRQTASQITAIFTNESCTARESSLNGTWRGTGHQTPAGDGGPDWSISMTISSNGASIDYPSLGCGGTLTQLSRTDTSAQFRESITYGRQRCIDGGTITVRYEKGQLAWTWVGSDSKGTNYNAIAVLSR